MYLVYLKSKFYRVGERISLASILVMLLTQAGCGGLENTKTMLAALGSDSSRTELLSERLKTFEKALYWKDNEALIAVSEPSIRREISTELRENTRFERLVEFIPGTVDLAPSGDEAVVTQTVRFFKPPVFTVQEREEIQLWTFNKWQGAWFLKKWNLGDRGIGFKKEVVQPLFPEESNNEGGRARLSSDTDNK